MILSTYIDNDSERRKRSFTLLSCDVCGKERIIQTRFIASFEGKHWCDRGCMSVLKGTAIKSSCAHCGKEFIRSRSKLSKPKSGLSFCNKKCKDAASLYLEEIRPEHYSDKNYRDRAFRAYAPICMECGFSNIKALEVHHIDRDRSNNKLSNLKILCANCHRIEH